MAFACQCNTSTVRIRRSVVIAAWSPAAKCILGCRTQNRSSLEPSLGFAATAGTPRIETGGTFAVDSADGRRDRHNIDVRPDLGSCVGSSGACTYRARSTMRDAGQWRQIQVKAQDYSGCGPQGGEPQ